MYERHTLPERRRMPGYEWEIQDIETEFLDGVYWHLYYLDTRVNGGYARNERDAASEVGTYARWHSRQLYMETSMHREGTGNVIHPQS